MPAEEDRSYRAQHEQHKEEDDRAHTDFVRARTTATELVRKARRVRIEGVKHIVDTRTQEHEDASRYENIKWE